MASTAGILSTGTSRFTVTTQQITSLSDPFNIQALQLVPGVNGQRVMKFKFFDSANHEFDFSVALSDIMFEAYNIFGGAKTTHDLQLMGQIY